MVTDNINRFISSIRSIDNIVICVGAGVSVSSGLPSTTVLMEEILSAFQPNDNDLKQELKNSDYQNLSLIIDYIIEEYGKETVDNIIRKIYKSSDIKPSELLNSIARFPAKAYVTTNIDTLLEGQLEYFQKDYEVYVNNLSPDTLHKNIVPVIKLNGSIDQGLSSTNYSKSIRFNIPSSPQLNSQFVSLIQSSVLLFVGFNLSSLEAFYELYSINANPEWFFLNVNNKNNLEQRLWGNRGINILNFESHNEIPFFLNSLASLIKSKPTKSPRKNNKIFISSSHEDANVANILRNKLENVGFSVFTVGESASAGLTIFEKIDKAISEAGTAIVLFPERKSNRSFENFMFEIGYLTAKLGRNNIFIIVPENVDKLPSDLSGNIYLKYDYSDSSMNKITDLVTLNFAK